MHLQRVGAVFQIVLPGDDPARQFPLLADGDEAGAEPAGCRRSEDEAARLDPGHLVDPAAGVELGDGLDRGAQVGGGRRSMSRERRFPLILEIYFQQSDRTPNVGRPPVISGP